MKQNINPEVFFEKIKERYSRAEARILYRYFFEDAEENFVVKWEEVCSALQSGKPYQQILGYTEFYGLKFFIDENVLIPRPETEELIEIAISKISNLTRGKAELSEAKSEISNLKIIDIGTGSGIIPITLKKHFPNAEISAIDFSEKALEIAEKNAAFHQTEINFIHKDYLNWELTDVYQIIISNPPYIGKNEIEDIEESVKSFEPNMALFSPTDDALVFYKKIAKDCENHLATSGFLFLEINQKLGKETLQLFKNFTTIELMKDLSQNDRFIFGIK